MQTENVSWQEICGKMIDLASTSAEIIPAMIKEAAAKGLPINFKSPAGNTLLHIAAIYGSPECCRALIESGADVNAQDSWGRTPLYRACWRGSSDCARLLLKSGADHRQVTDKFVSV